MKKIFKLLPVSVFDFPGLELWLGQMANEGLFPVKIRSPLAVFTRTGTPGTRFRVEPCGTEVYDGVGPDQDKRDLYRGFGWELAFAFHNDGNVLALFYTATPSAPELYTDLSAQAATLEPMLDHFRRKLRHMPFPLVMTLWATRSSSSTTPPIPPPRSSTPTSSPGGWPLPVCAKSSGGTCGSTPS